MGLIDERYIKLTLIFRLDKHFIMGDAGDEQKGGILKSLENFVFKEVLGGDIARKVCVV